MKFNNIAILAITVVIFNGCAVKHNDNIAVKAVKHTLMTPIYAGEALTKTRDLAIIGTLGVIAKGVETIKSNDNTKTEDIVK